MIWTEGDVPWFLSMGGNLLVCDNITAWNWHGDERAPGLSCSDFACASEVEQYVGTVSVGERRALVLGGEPLPTRLWADPARQNEYFVIRQMRGNDQALGAMLNKLPRFSFTAEGIELTFSDSLLRLLDAAKTMQPGKHGKPEITLQIAPGRYYVSTCHYLPDVLTYFIVHRLRRIANNMSSERALP